MEKTTREKIDEHLKDAYETLSKNKRGCVTLFKLEFDGVINWSGFAKEFNRTNAWLAQKFKGCSLPVKDKPFTEEEYSKLTQSLREMAEKLNQYADMIDKAENDIK